jgi:hypothetical protein
MNLDRAKLIGCVFGNRRGFAASGVSEVKPTHLIGHQRIACGLYVGGQTIASAITTRTVPGAWSVDGAAVTNLVFGIKTSSSPQANTKGFPTRLPKVFAANSAAAKHTHIVNSR